jgi:hypothetical protein
MKKLSFILIVLAILTYSCAKENKYTEIKVDPGPNIAGHWTLYYDTVNTWLNNKQIIFDRITAGGGYYLDFNADGSGKDYYTKLRYKRDGKFLNIDFASYVDPFQGYNVAERNEVAQIREFTDHKLVIGYDWTKKDENGLQGSRVVHVYQR